MAGAQKRAERASRAILTTVAQATERSQAHTPGVAAACCPIFPFLSLFPFPCDGHPPHTRTQLAAGAEKAKHPSNPRAQASRAGRKQAAAVGPPCAMRLAAREPGRRFGRRVVWTTVAVAAGVACLLASPATASARAFVSHQDDAAQDALVHSASRGFEVRPATHPALLSSQNFQLIASVVAPRGGMFSPTHRTTARKRSCVMSELGSLSLPQKHISSLCSHSGQHAMQVGGGRILLQSASDGAPTRNAPT